MVFPDLEKYRSFAVDLDMTDAQKDELIIAIWNIMGDFVSQAFGVHPFQQCRMQGENAPHPHHIAQNRRTIA